MTKVNKISDLSFLFVSFCASGWSVYWSQKFFSEIIEVKISWVISVLVFGFCSHIFIHQGLKDVMINKNWLSPSLVLFILIFSTGVYIDLSGIDFHNYENEVLSTKQKNDFKIDQKENEISFIKEEIQKNKNWNSEKGPNWAMHAVWLKSKKELETLRGELDTLRKIADNELKDSKYIADQKTKDLSGGVIIAYLLLIISNIGVIQSVIEQEKEINHSSITHQPVIEKHFNTIEKQPIIEQKQVIEEKSIIENDRKMVGFVPNEKMIEEKSMTKKKLSYINDFPKTINLLIQGKSIREAINEASEGCTYYKAQKISKEIKNS